MSRYRGPGLLTMLMQSAMQDASNSANARMQADQQVRGAQLGQLNALFGNSAQYGDAVSDELAEYGKKWGAPVEALRAQQPEIFNRVAVHPRTAWFAERGQSTPEEMLNAGGYKDFNRAMASNPEAFQQALMSQAALQGMSTPGGQEALGALGNKAPDASSVFQAPGGLMNALIQGTDARSNRDNNQILGRQSAAHAQSMARAEQVARLGIESDTWRAMLNETRQPQQSQEKPPSKQSIAKEILATASARRDAVLKDFTLPEEEKAQMAETAWRQGIKETIDIYGSVFPDLNLEELFKAVIKLESSPSQGTRKGSLSEPDANGVRQWRAN